MKSFSCIAAFAVLLCIGCAQTVPYGGSPNAAPGPKFDPAVAAAMTKVCASLPLQAAGGANKRGNWTTYTDNACGGMGYLAGAAAPAVPTANAPRIPASTAPPAMENPVLVLPGIASAVPGDITYAVDFVGPGTYEIEWHIVPLNYFGTANGLDETYNQWSKATISGPTRLVMNNLAANLKTCASLHAAEVVLELRVPPGTKISGFSGAIRQ